jgi:hypothetical protein
MSTDLLDQISRNPGAAVLIALVIVILAGILAGIVSGILKFINNALCAFTGKYPPPRPVVECSGDCDCNQPCKCCDENECQVGCGCSTSVTG